MIFDSGSLKRYIQSVCSTKVLCGFEGVSTGTVDMAQAATPVPLIGRVVVPEAVAQALQFQ